MRKFRRIRISISPPYKLNTIYSGDGRFEGFMTVLESFNADPQCWEEVFDKPKLFKLL